MTTTTSIATTLGAGSGVDTSALVKSLVDAQFAAKTARLKTKSDALTTQISGVSTLKSGISGFSTALASLVRGGTLATAATSSNTAVLKATALSGASIAGLSSSVEVRQVARPQSSASAVVADRTAAIGTGGFTLTFGTATVSNGAMTGFTAGPGTPVSIAIDAGHASLDGIASAINAAGAGVTASVVSDAGGARLTIKGATGASQAFTLQSADAGLSDLNVGVGATGTTIGSVAQDAIVAVDGTTVARASNTITNLIDGVRLDVVATGTVSLSATSPTAALGQAVSDFVTTYNGFIASVREQTNSLTGVLKADPAATALQRALGQLPLTRLTPVGASDPATLAEIGVGTNRDGTLSVDTARLSKALTSYPGAVEKIFADGSGESGGGLSAALTAIASRAISTTAGLGASETRYTKAQSVLSEGQSKSVDEAAAMKTRLTRQFAGSEARVAAYKSTQSFLKAQVAAWNNTSN